MDKVSSDRIFTRKQLEDILSVAVGKTIREIDSKHLLDAYSKFEKEKGSIGDVVELSLLGCERNSKQEPDLMVDGVLTELKTTGVQKPKKKGSPYLFECKEPVSITAVSIDTIVTETFETSNFWHKLAHMLWVYYWYKSPVKVPVSEYANFTIEGYQFWEFNTTDRQRLKNDWQAVQGFLIKIHQDYPDTDDRKKQYPRLSSELRGVLLLIDTAPKYPNPPRFRLKRSFATTIAAQCLSKKALQPLRAPITQYSQVDEKCRLIEAKYRGKTVSQLVKKMNITSRVTSKNIGELIVLRMFGVASGKLNQIEDFVKIGLIAKTVTLRPDGEGKEDTKFYKPDWDDIVACASFEDSMMYEYFAEHSFLFIVFKQGADQRPENNIFVGFRRIAFSDDFLIHEVERTWNEIRDLLVNKKLRIEPVLSHGKPVVNPCGTIRESPNFPKRKGDDPHKVFVRGGAANSENRTLVLNGLKMIPQYIWLDKEYVVDVLLKDIEL